LKVLRRVVLAGALAACVAPAQASAAGTGLNAYQVKVTGKSLQTLAQNGFDVTEGRHGDTIEIISTASQARSLAKSGVTAKLKRDSKGRTALQQLQSSIRADGSYDVYRPYFDHTYVGTVGNVPGGTPRQTLYEEMQSLAESRPDLVKPEIVGHSVHGVPILALKVTKDARTTPDGQRPAVLYDANQHAREWITAESVRRFAHLFVDNYSNPADASEADATDGSDLAGEAGDLTKGDITRLVNTNELWFLVVANPDGYDFTFTPGNRLWRKNTREINGQAGTQVDDGVDPNRNFPTKWGYDNEGSGAVPVSETYRGPSPASEPETQAMDGLLKRIGFEFQINYHSAAELLLYPIGWQQTTYTADDPIYRALSGTDDDPAIKGQEPGAPDFYDPDVSAELYITNGETTDQAHTKYGTLAWTPEMDVSDPDRGGGDSVFIFQDSEADLEDAFEKNIPFALDLARSAHDPANPVSHLENEVPAFELRPFDVSYGDPQTVEVDAKRELGPVTVHWTVDGDNEQSSSTQEWTGGEVYGGPGDVYFHRMRGTVTGTKPGDDVRVWFEGGGHRSQSFTYSVASDSGAPVLIMSAEDYSGKPGAATESPAYADRTKPNYLSYYTAALQASGIGYDVYDVDGRGRTAPDALGVLSHYKAVIWYTANDLFIREAGAPGGTGTSRLAQDEIVNVRDYLNDGGKLLYTGKNAADGALTGFPYNPAGQPPYCDAAGVETPEEPDPNLIPVARCAVLNDDFLQYWLGAYVHIAAADDPAGAAALGLFNEGGPFGSTPFGLNGPDSADNQDHTYSVVTTSSILPPAQFPQFDSHVATGLDAPPAFDPPTGTQYMYAKSGDESWQRLRKTVDLTGAGSGSLKFKISYDTEADFDFVVVEAHTVGQDDWTTLEEAGGGTEENVGASCDINWDTLHPFLTHYQTNIDKSEDPGDEDCLPVGTTGTPPGHWFGATGNSAGFHDWEFDLSDYAGQQVEVSISYIQDFAVAGLGVFVDDAVITKDGAVAEQTSFEDDTGGWTAGPGPAGSSDRDQWQRQTSAGFKDGPGVATDDTLYYGFGFEGIAGVDKRNGFMADAMRYLGVLGQAGGGSGETPGGGGGGGGGGKSLRVDSKRRAKVKLFCGPSAGTRCRGVLGMTFGGKTLGRRSIDVPAGRDVTVTLSLTRSAYRTLVRRKRLRVTLTLVTRGSDGQLRRASARVTVVRGKPPKRRR
jgi:hypothetical protein